MKYFIYLFLILSLIVLGCSHDKVQPTPTPEPAPAPQPPIWQPKPEPTPTPGPVTCTDTDGGSDVNVKGTTTKGELIRTDICDGNRVLEYYCTDNDLYELSQVCTYGCSDGACIMSTPTPAGIPPGASTKCSDSESGDDPLRVGTVTVEYAEYGSSVYQTYGTWSDSCISSTAVKEVFCDSTKPDRYSTKSVACPSGKTCSGGKCGAGTTPTPTCTDSDGGKNYDVKGTVMKGTDEEDRATDVCLTITPTVLAEFYCDSSGNIRSEDYTCPNGCSDGACTTDSNPTPDPTPECTSNSGCGYKKICTNGVCESVDCTSDSQCTGCKKCSGYRCVRCGYGPYGCTC